MLYKRLYDAVGRRAKPHESASGGRNGDGIWVQGAELGLTKLQRGKRARDGEI